MARPDCLVPLNDLYIACSYQRFTELIVCMMNIIEKVILILQSTSVSKLHGHNNDGKIRVYDASEY